MRNTNALLRHMFLACGIISFALPNLYLSADDQLKSLVLQLGSIEPKTDGSRGWVFKWNGEEEVYDMAAKLGSSRGPGLGGGLVPGLREIGIQMKSGLVCEYGNQRPDLAMKKFIKENPGEVGDSVIFENSIGERLVLSMKQPTSICRVDVVIDSRNLWIWKLIPNKPVRPSE